MSSLINVFFKIIITHTNINGNSSWYSRKWASQVVLVVQNLPANARDIRDAGLIPGLGRSPGGGHGNPLQYSYLENPKDRGAWRAAVHRLTKSRTWLKRQHSHAHSRRYSRMYIYWLCKESLTVKSLMHNNDPFFKRYSWFSMLCWFLLYVHMHPLFSGLPSHLGHHRALSGVPCAAH